MSARSKQSGQLRTIEELCDFSNGHGFGPTTWATSGLPIIRIQNLNGSRDFNYFAGDPESNWIVAPGTLLFAWAGTKGVSFGPTIWDGPRGVLNQHIYKVHPKDGVDKRWLFNSLKIVTERIEKKAHGFKSTLLHVGKSDITGQQVLTPPLPEQQKIADILGTWDEALEKLDALIAAKARRYSGLLETSLRQHGNAECKVRDVTCETGPRNRANAVSRVLSVTNTQGFVLPEEYFDKQVASSDTSSYKIVRRGEYAYNPSRINVGSIARLESWDDGIVSPIYVVFALNEMVEANYFHHWLKSHEARSRIRRSAQGSVRDSVNFDDFGFIQFPLPTRGKQRAIAAVLDTADAELRLIRQQRTSLDHQKRGLMQQLLTGKVRVSI